MPQHWSSIYGNLCGKFPAQKSIRGVIGQQENHGTIRERLKGGGMKGVGTERYAGYKHFNYEIEGGVEDMMGVARVGGKREVPPILFTFTRIIHSSEKNPVDRNPFKNQEMADQETTTMIDWLI